LGSALRIFNALVDDAVVELTKWMVVSAVDRDHILKRYVNVNVGMNRETWSQR
jgi:hypothetical protein